VEDCWSLLTDLERVAPCVPGFTPSGWDSDTYTGSIKVKVGAVTVTYDSRITLVEADSQNHHASIQAEGRERRGQGSASAMMHSQLRAAGDVTEVTMTADVDVSGRVASFGRGILADVSSRLVSRFARNVESTFLHPAGESLEAASPSADAASHIGGPSPTTAATPSPEEPLDLVTLAGGPTLRRLLPAVAALALLLILLRRMSR